MKKFLIVSICIVTIIGGIFLGIAILEKNKNKEKEHIKNAEIKIAEEEILDECTEEYEEIAKMGSIETNSEEEKISPNCSLTIKSYYKICRHTKKIYQNMPEELTNKTRKEIEEYYNEYKIEKFSSNEVIIYEEIEEECNEHYILKEKEGKISINLVTENGIETEIEKTEIEIEYLPEEDQKNIKQGIRVDGKQELNRLIEDFE